MTGWINVGRPYSSEPTSPPPPNDFHDHRGDTLVRPQDVVEPAEAKEIFDATGDLKVEYSAYDHYIQRALKHKDTMKKQQDTRGGEDPDRATATRRLLSDLATGAIYRVA
jgi:hypothetical protein